MPTRYLGGNTKKYSGNMSQEVRKEIRTWDSHQHLVGISSQLIGWDHKKICKYWGPKNELWSTSNTNWERTCKNWDGTVNKETGKPGECHKKPREEFQEADIKTAKAINQWLSKDGWSLVQKHQHHLEICEKYKLSGSNSKLLSPRIGPSNLWLNKPFGWF